MPVLRVCPNACATRVVIEGPIIPRVGCGTHGVDLVEPEQDEAPAGYVVQTCAHLVHHGSCQGNGTVLVPAAQAGKEWGCGPCGYTENP